MRYAGCAKMTVVRRSDTTTFVQSLTMLITPLETNVGDSVSRLPTYVKYTDVPSMPTTVTVLAHDLHMPTFLIQRPSDIHCVHNNACYITLISSEFNGRQIFTTYVTTRVP